MDTHYALATAITATTLAKGGLGNTEAVIVVPIRGGIPVAVSRTQVRRFIVPGAAAKNALAQTCAPEQSILLLNYLCKDLRSFFVGSEPFGPTPTPKH